MKVRRRQRQIRALAWAIRVAGELDFANDCDKRFVTMLPILKANEASAEFRRRVNPRAVTEVVGACDLAYCLHWAIRQSELRRERLSGNLKPYVVVERRRALEWLLSQDDWDEVPLDT